MSFHHSATVSLRTAAQIPPPGGKSPVWQPATVTRILTNPVYAGAYAFGRTGSRVTVDELAQRTGVPSSTIRMYQTRGLLPKPRRDGRVGRYGPAHLARLELIGQLHRFAVQRLVGIVVRGVADNQRRHRLIDQQ